MAIPQRMMTMRATVERDVAGQQTDDFGTPITTVTTVYSALPCYAWARGADENTTLDGKKIATIGDFVLVAGPGSTLHPRDRVTGIVDADGDAVFGDLGRLRIMSARRRVGWRRRGIDYIEAVLERTV